MYGDGGRFKYISTIAIYCFLLFFALMMSGCSSEGVFQRESIDGLADLKTYIQGLDDQLSSDQQSDLLAKLDDADDAYSDEDPCGAAGYLGEYLDACQDLRVGDLTDLAEDLFNRGWMIRSDLLASLSEPCAGYEGVGANPEVMVSESDNTHVTASISFGEPRMWTVTVEGQVFTQLQVPGVAFPMSPEGYPAVPVYRRFVAVPQEAEVSVSATANGAQTIRMNLHPVQTQPMDADDEELSFVQDEDAYATDANYPENIFDVQIIDKIRDVYIAQVTCAAGQYNPVTDTITLYDSVDFVVNFTGGTGAFITERSMSPFDRTLSLMDGIVINSDKLVDYVEPAAEATLGGEELLILTHPDFLGAAERLAEWKNDKGIITKIYTVCDGDGPGPDENSEIDAWIKNHYYSNIIHPSYILIIGDAEFVPTFDLRSHNVYIGTDYPYSVLEEFETTSYAGAPPYPLPDMALGRIPVDTLDEANIVVDKIITYESAPPAQDSFYRNASVVGAFQCCRDTTTKAGWALRTFIESAEFCRDVMQGEGISVERIYTKICREDIEECIPRYYYDGTLLPEDLSPDSGFAWDGDTQDIINAFTSDQGRFLIIHRDHGSEFGWEHPFFGNDDASNLDGQIAGMLPVVFSINCITGIFDNETAYFNENSGYEIQEDEIYLCERLLRNPNGGAIACIGASRPSPSWPNTYLTMGMIDAIWPEAIADFGGQEAMLRLGDILNYGKLYMLDIGGVNCSTENDLLLHHCIGDPTLEIWTQPPEELPEDATLQDTVDGVRVDYGVDGTVVTIYQETPAGVVALGRGTIENGQANISYIQEPDESYPIEISVSKPGYVAGVLLTPLMEISSDSLSFGSEGTELSLTISNTGGGTLDWSLADSLPAWLQLSATTSQIAVGESEVVTVTVDRTGLAGGDYEHDLVFDTNVLNVESETLAVSVSMTVETSIPTFPLLKTGLTVSYDEDGKVATGLFDDGYYQQGNAFSYTANGDGTVTDNVTGLRWMQSGSDSELTFAEAQSYCSAQTLDGGGWRIPNVYEYYTILNFSQDNPALDHSFFSSMSGFYWTATQMADSTLYVWSIREPYADDYIFNGVGGSNYVRCVKGTALEPPATGRFTDNGSDTVLDTWTGLVWEAASDHNGASGYTWEEALSYCEAKTTLGRKWHLPNVKQMQSLLSKDVAEPAIDTGFFTNDSYTLWTSTTDVYTNSGDSDLAWAASEGGYGDFTMGGVFKTSRTDDFGWPMGVRCVSCP